MGYKFDLHFNGRIYERGIAPPIFPPLFGVLFFS